MSDEKRSNALCILGAVLGGIGYPLITILSMVGVIWLLSRLPQMAQIIITATLCVIVLGLLAFAAAMVTYHKCRGGSDD